MALGGFTPNQRLDLVALSFLMSTKMGEYNCRAENQKARKGDLGLLHDLTVITC